MLPESLLNQNTIAVWLVLETDTNSPFVISVSGNGAGRQHSIVSHSIVLGLNDRLTNFLPGQMSQQSMTCGSGCLPYGRVTPPILPRPRRNDQLAAASPCLKLGRLNAKQWQDRFGQNFDQGDSCERPVAHAPASRRNLITRLFAQVR